MSYQEIQILISAVDRASGALRDVASAAGDMGREVKNAGDKAAEAIEKADRAVQFSTRDLKTLIGDFSSVATAAFSLYDAYDRVSDMSVSVSRANLQVQSALNAVEDAQRRYNEAVAKYGPNSERAIAAAKDLQIAQERYAVATERAEVMQGNLNEAMVQSAIRVIPAVISLVSNLSDIVHKLPQAFNTLKTAIEGATASQIAFTAALGAGIGAAAAFSVEVFGLVKSYGDMQDAMNKGVMSVDEFMSEISQCKDALGMHEARLRDWAGWMRESGLTASENAKRMAEMGNNVYFVGRAMLLAGYDTETIIDAFEDLGYQFRGRIEDSEQMKDATEDLGKSLNDLSDIYVQKLIDSDQHLQLSIHQTAQKILDLMGTVQNEEEFLKRSQEAIDNLAKQYNISFDQAKNAVKDAMEAIQAKMEKTGEATTENSEEMQERMRQFSEMTQVYIKNVVMASDDFQASLRETALAVLDLAETSANQEEFAEKSAAAIRGLVETYGISFDQAKSAVEQAMTAIQRETEEKMRAVEANIREVAENIEAIFREMGEEAGLSMDQLVDDVTAAISMGLLGRAQQLMDEFKEREPNKMWDMVEKIDEAITVLQEEMNATYAAMLAEASRYTGAEYDLMVAAADKTRSDYLAKIEQLQAWRAQILAEMISQSQGWSEQEKSLWESVMIRIAEASQLRWDEILKIWNKSLAEAQGNVAQAVKNMQNYINSLTGKTITITTQYVTSGGPPPPGVSGATTAERMEQKLGMQFGMPYVPYTGLTAVLHKGEAVLTAAQAREWRESLAGARQIIVNFGPVTVAGDMDVRMVARKLADYIRQEERRMGLD